MCLFYNLSFEIFQKSSELSLCIKLFQCTYMMICSNTLVYFCECFFYLVFLSMCLVLSYIYCHVSHSDAIDENTGSVECVCMYICLYVYIYVGMYVCIDGCNCNLFQDTILIFATGTGNNLKRVLLK